MASLVVVVIPAIASVAAAVVAGVFAWSTRRTDRQVERIRELETRISERKYATYKPLIDILTELLRPDAPQRDEASEAAMQASLRDFATWISIYGSDEAVDTFHKFMQVAVRNPPSVIALRLLGDFLVAARKDMGYPYTKIGRKQILGTRITDLYDHPDLLDPSFDEVCSRLDWTPPWIRDDLVPDS